MMAEVKAKLPGISVMVGDAFDVTLQSMAGSTGYSWYLRSMPRCVVLASMKSEPVHQQAGVIGPTRHTFTFIAMEVAEASLEFDLLAVWRPLDVADRRIYPLTVTEQKTADLESDIAGRFHGAGSHVVHQPAVPPYGFPTAVVESAERCILMYGFPGGIAMESEHCTLKYGFPIHVGPVYPLYGFPPPYVKYGVGYGAAANAGLTEKHSKSCVIPLYGYPHPLPIEVVEDPAQCVVKYGFPTGITTEEEKCVLKYGYPILKYGFPTCDKQGG